MLPTKLPRRACLHRGKAEMMDSQQIPKEGTRSAAPPCATYATLLHSTPHQTRLHDCIDFGAITLSFTCTSRSFGYPNALNLSVPLSMSWLASLVLALIHAVYSLFIWLRTVRPNRHERIPLELNAKRSKAPKHLGLILAYDASLDDHEEIEQVLVACLRSAVGCAQVAGIQQLTVYDRDGASASHSKFITMSTHWL